MQDCHEFEAPFRQYMNYAGQTVKVLSRIFFMGPFILIPKCRSLINMDRRRDLHLLQNQNGFFLFSHQKLFGANRS